MADGRKNNGGPRKGAGRKGYNYEIIIQQALKIVEDDLRNTSKVLNKKERFYAALELVKKALPNNVDFGEKTLKLLFDKAFLNE